jgi:hypothetical protein
MHKSNRRAKYPGLVGTPEAEEHKSSPPPHRTSNCGTHPRNDPRTARDRSTFRAERAGSESAASTAAFGTPSILKRSRSDDAPLGSIACSRWSDRVSRAAARVPGRSSRPWYARCVDPCKTRSRRRGLGRGHAATSLRGGIFPRLAVSLAVIRQFSSLRGVRSGRDKLDGGELQSVKEGFPREHQRAHADEGPRTHKVQDDSHHHDVRRAGVVLYLSSVVVIVATTTISKADAPTSLSEDARGKKNN